jgi:hypothetical protein
MYTFTYFKIDYLGLNEFFTSIFNDILQFF